MMRISRLKRFISLPLFVCGLWGTSIAQADPGCQNAKVIGPKLITDICWSCLFPIRIAGLPRPGVTTSMWEPAQLVEFQRVPGCSSVLNGTRFPFNRTFQGHHGTGSLDGGDGSFMHYHFYAFPLLTLLELFVRPNCNPDGYMDLDVLYFSELDPTWNNDELAFFTNPEAAAVANP